MIVLENGQLVVELDPAAGAQIRRISRPGGPNALAWYDWKSPVPADESIGYGDSELDWKSRYRGGWQELFPNAGAACVVDGVPLPFHGEVSSAPWWQRAVAPDHCELVAHARLPLTVTRRMTLAEARPVLLIEETVTNDSPLEVEFVWGHHPVFPALAGAQVDLPRCSVEAEPKAASGLSSESGRWPWLPYDDGTLCDVSRIPDMRLERLLYASDLSAGWAALRQPAPQVGVAMAWDLGAFPCVWLWLQRDMPQFPWYGRARMLGIEPHTAFPFDGLAAAREHGEAHRLGPHASRSAWLTITLLDEGDAPVTGVERDGRVRRAERR